MLWAQRQYLAQVVPLYLLLRRQSSTDTKDFTDFNRPILSDLLAEIETPGSSVPESSVAPTKPAQTNTTINEESSVEENVSDLPGVHVRMTCLSEAADTLMKVLIDVEGTSVVALLDTSATKSMIDCSLLNQTSIPYDKSSNIHIFGVAESEGIPAAGQVLLTTNIDGVDMEPILFSFARESTSCFGHPWNGLLQIARYEN